MSIQIGSSTLSTYRNFKEQLVLTTSSNLPILSLDTTHSSNNIFVRTGRYISGQSNSSYIIGFSNAQSKINNTYTPILQYLDNSKIIKFYQNIDASNINTTIGKLDVATTLQVPKILTSNIVIVFNSNTSLPNILQEQEFIVKTQASNLFIINGYNNNSYFTGNLGIGTTIPNNRLHTMGLRVDGDSKLTNISLDTISFNNYDGITMQIAPYIDQGSVLKVGRNTLFDSNVIIAGNLSVNRFEIINLNTNRGDFKGIVNVQNAIEIYNASNEIPTLTLERNYIETDDFYDSNNLGCNIKLQPLVKIQYTTSSNNIRVTQPVFQIDPMGKIGIGTTSPHRLLDIYSYSNAELMSNIGMFGIHGDRDEEIFCVDNNAFVGIGTSTPRYYMDMVMHSNSFAFTQSPAFLSISKEATPVLWLTSNGNFGVHTKNTKNNVAIKVAGVLETEYLSVHRIIPVEGEDVHFTNCNIDAVRSINASNAFIPIIYTSNVYADFISASNYDLLAFNSYRSTKELEFELDDMIFSGRTFVMSRAYVPYFEQIGGTNPFGGLEGTTDPNLSNKPTDKLNVAKSGKLHMIADGEYTTANNDSLFPVINNGLVFTTSNTFNSTINQTVIPFIHVEGHGPGGGKRRIGGYSIGVTNPNLLNSDCLSRITLETNPVESLSAFDTAVLSMKPYDNNSRRVGWRYSYSTDVFRLPRMFITANGISEIDTVNDNNIITSVVTPLAIYTKGNIRVDSSDSSRTIFHAMKNTVTDRVTFSIGQSLVSTTNNSLEVYGNAKITEDTLIERVLTVNSNIYAKSVISQTSDARLKDELEIIDKPLDKISQLTGYTFRRTDLKTRDAGLIAQDVLQVLPEIVSKTDDGYYSLAYGNMAGLFVESIKKLTQRIEVLESQVQDLTKALQNNKQ